jgi:hypothetical protein
MIGRKRRFSAREPNGRIQRETEYAPTQIRRLRDAALRGLRDPEWGTELGRLYLESAINDVMYRAGNRWREQASRYRNAIGVFPIHSASVEPVARAMTPDPDSDEGREQARRETDAAERFFAAHAALIASGALAENAVRRLCEEDQSLIGISELKAARCGLQALAMHYGLTNQGKSGDTVRNAS